MPSPLNPETLARLVIQLATAAGSDPGGLLAHVQAITADDDAADAAGAALAQLADLVASLEDLRRAGAPVLRAYETGGEALTAVALWRVLRAGTPDDPAHEVWRAEQDAALETLDARLQAELAGGREDRVTHEENVGRENEDDWNDALDDHHQWLDAHREPLGHARGATDQRLTLLRRYLYSKLNLNWIAYAAPCHITTVDQDANLCTVRLDDGSGQSIDGVDYGSGTPHVGQPTVLYVPARRPADPALPRVQPQAGGRAWVVLPPGNKTLYYSNGGKLWRLPWPPGDADATPTLMRDWLSVIQWGTRFVGIDGNGTAWFWWYDQSSAPPSISNSWDFYNQFVMGWKHFGAGDPVGPYAFPRSQSAHENAWSPACVDATPGHDGFFGWHKFETPAGEALRTNDEWGYAPAASPTAFVNTTGIWREIDAFPPVPFEHPAFSISEWRMLQESNQYRLWTDDDGTRRALFASWHYGEPYYESFPFFYFWEYGGNPQVNATAARLWFAGPGPEGGKRGRAITIDDYRVGGQLRRIDDVPNGAPTILSAPFWRADLIINNTEGIFPHGQGRRMDDLLVMNRERRTWWYSTDAGDSWTESPYRPAYPYTGEGLGAYIVDESEVGA